eukprot:1788174-Amphidinium_carterae.1
MQRLRNEQETTRTVQFNVNLSTRATSVYNWGAVGICLREPSAAVGSSVTKTFAGGGWRAKA